MCKKQRNCFLCLVYQCSLYYIDRSAAVHFEEALSVVQKGSRSRDSILTLLKTIRLNKIRESRLVIEFGTLALKKFGNSLGDEKWTILEQVFLAALDTGDRDLADSCIQQLIAKFKDSSRVSRLLGMQNESIQQYGAASETYSKLLETNPANALALKRKVAIFKAQGKMNEAVRELNE
jgi:ER membrane protein complex subunit 2